MKSLSQIMTAPSLASAAMAQSPSEAKYVELEHWSDINEAGLDLEEMSVDHEQVLAAYEQASALSFDLESNDGLSKQFVAGAGVILGRLEIDLESFDLESLSDGSSTFDLEEKESMVSKLADKIKQFWNYLKNQAIKIAEGVMSFISRLMGGWDALQKRAEAALEALKKGAKEGDIKMTGAVKVAIADRYDDKVATNGLKLIDSEFVTIKKLSATLGALAEVKIDAMIKGTKDTESEDEVKSVFAKAAASAKTVWAKVTGESKEKPAIITTPELPGGRVYRIEHEQMKNGETTDEFITAFSAAYKMPSIVQTVSDAKISNTVEMPALSEKFAADVVASVKEGVKISKEMNKTIADLKVANEAAIKEWDAAIALADKGTLGKYWTKARVRTFSYMIGRQQARPLTRYVAYTYSVLRTYVSHVEASAK